MTDSYLAIVTAIVERFSQLPEVESIALAGSRASRQDGHLSDVDLYVYSRVDIPAAERQAIGREFSPDVQLVDFWGPGLEWDDSATGIHIDVIFFTTGWLEDQQARVLKRHEAWLGYSTCFWHTVRLSQILFDRNGWFAQIQLEAQQPYPDALAQAIVRQNFPVLRDSFSSYRYQLEKAISRDDRVSIQHRITGFLASYFDILFAINRLTHPGEKRLLQLVEQTCSKYPPNMRSQVEALLRAGGVAPNDVLLCVDLLVDELEILLKNEALLG